MRHRRHRHMCVLSAQYVRSAAHTGSCVNNWLQLQHLHFVFDYIKPAQIANRFNSIRFDFEKSNKVHSKPFKCTHIHSHISLILILSLFSLNNMRLLLFIHLIHMVYYRARYSLDIFINHDFPHNRSFSSVFFQIIYTRMCGWQVNNENATLEFWNQRTWMRVGFSIFHRLEA